MNRLFFLSAPVVSVMLAVSLETTLKKDEALQLEFEGTARAVPACTLGDAKEGKLGFDPDFPDQLSSRHAEGQAGSIGYTLSSDARATIFLTPTPEFLKSPAAAVGLPYAFQASFGGQNNAPREDRIAIGRGGAGKLELHLMVKTQDGSFFPAGPYVAQVIVTCDPVM